MYRSGEDFYLYCYSIFVILDSLGCNNQKHFRDYKKLAFLVNIINDEKTVYVICNSQDGQLNPRDQERLLDSYTDGLTCRSEILKLLFVLEKKGYVVLERGNAQEIDVSLRKESLPSEFLTGGRFGFEYANIKKLSKKITKLSMLTLSTMLDKIYSQNGVKTWVL
jgi:hypothetical protein